MDHGFGNLKKVEIRELWKNEASDFTKWLSQKENLDLLAEELQIPLEHVETEKSVGAFSIDIVAKIPNPDSENEEFVVIENQLEDSDHDHLGKLVTYAAGVEAKIVVLVCKELRDEHRTAINWLNRISNRGETRFFAIRVEAWKIDNSNPAPKFTILCEPDNWAKEQREHVETKENLTETKKFQYNFWNAFSEFLSKNKSSLRTRKIYPQHWCDFAIGSGKAHISMTLNTQNNTIGCAFYVPNDREKRIFRAVNSNKASVEKEIGSELVWMELPGKKASRVKLVKNFANILDENSWQSAFEWLKDKGERFKTVFPKYLKNLED